jgi:hypothetical protein
VVTDLCAVGKSVKDLGIIYLDLRLYLIAQLLIDHEGPVCLLLPGLRLRFAPLHLL